MRTFSCRDVGFTCLFVARGESDAQVLEQVAKHLREAHRMSVTPDLANRIEWLIRDADNATQGAA